MSGRTRSRWRTAALGTSIALGVGLAALAAYLFPYRPVVVVGAAPAPGPYAWPASQPGLRLHVFTTGMNRMSSVLVGDERPWRPAPAFVLEHPRAGLVVFDCGLADAVAREGEAALGVPMRWLLESRGRPGRTLDAQMREAGMDPAAVRWVLVSHLHEDHLGAAPAFPQATFVGGPGTADHVFEGGFAPRWQAADRGPTIPLPPFDPATDLFGDGSVVLVPGGGHAREDVMAFVALPGGPVLLAGDAVVHFDWLASDDVQRIAVDPARAADVRNRVRAAMLARPALVVIPGHDLRGLPAGRDDLVVHHPEYLAPEAWPIGDLP